MSYIMLLLYFVFIKSALNFADLIFRCFNISCLKFETYDHTLNRAIHLDINCVISANITWRV